MKTSKRVCNLCGKEAKFMHDGKWWCSSKSGFGQWNLLGYCNTKKKGVE